MLNFSSVFLKFISLILGISEMGAFPPPLSAKEEAALFAKMKDGDKCARDKIIEHNMRLVSHIIRKYYSAYQYPDDLLSIGSLGLVKATDSFNAERGVRFATFAARCIQNEILMFFRSQKKVSMEVSLSDTIDVDKDGNPLTYLDIISSPEHIAEDIDMAMHIEKIRTLVETELDERERNIIVLRYGLKGYKPLTQREVARHLGISRSYVSRIEKRALEILKNAFGGIKPDFDD
jgi:RNA polymerase sporulation-specific sigma factor